MLRFEHKEYFLLLLLIPAITLLYFFIQRQLKKEFASFGNREIIGRLIPDKNEKKSQAKLIILNLLILFLTLALAQPQMGTKLEKVQRRGIDVVIALDLSRSMLARDVVPSRLEKSKLLIQSLLKKLDGDRVGLVVFAGNAYLQMPLTVDYSSLLLYLRSINANTVPTQGTVISQALETANDAFNAKEQKYKAVIVITDGEDHEEDAIDKAESVASDGTRIFTVGVGSKQGGTIPVYNESGNIIGDKKDENGQTIISKLNENMLQALAKAGDGNYYILDNAKQVADFLSKDIAKMETKTIRDKTFSDYVEQFQYFVIFALLALLADIFLTYRKKWTDFKNEK